MSEPNWTMFCKRTEDPKLRYIEMRLDDIGIPHRRNGESFHAPILEVPDDRLEEADQMLQEPFDLGNTVIPTLDDVEDDHPFFEQFVDT